MSEFKYKPSNYVPFRDEKILQMARKITTEDFLNYSHPNVKLKVIKEQELGFIFLIDMFFRIKEGLEGGQKFTMIVGQPWPFYKLVAHMLNRARINCRNLHVFNMDEYANEDGVIAPEDWPLGFTHALKKYFYNEIDPALRPPEKQMQGFTNENFKYYGKMIEDLGGADLCYQGPGWTGHFGFVEPDAPEVPKTLEEFVQMGPRIVTLSPFTLAQNSLHGSFGSSGDIAAIPPKAATIGPVQSLTAKQRLSCYSIGVHGTSTSWQRLITRISLFGPVTPLVPDSIIQLKPAEAWVSDMIAKNIEVDWDKGY
jgi:glucosamine-6-phosphate deaminase